MLGSRVFRSVNFWVALLTFGCFAQPLMAEQVELADLIDKVEPSVVRIDVKHEEGSGIGSGFVVDADGIVVTNHHVIAGATEANAVFANGQSAKVLGTLMMDPKRDIAILKIDKTGLPVLKLAEKTPRKGESVVACGAPRGLSFSYSEGIVSGIRSGKEAAIYIGEEVPGTWLQITAPVSPGNSGGPLVNRAGEVVAANTMASLGGGAQNLNFSISSVDIADVLAKGRKKELVALTDGAAKSKHERAKPKRNELAAKDIKKEKIEAYVKSAKNSYKEAVTDARKQMSEAKKKLSDMKAGNIGALAVQSQRTVVKLIKGKQYYEYPDQKTKSEEIKKQQEEVATAEEHFNKIQDPQTGMVSYLTQSGPRTELKEIGDVGCVSDIFIMTITDSDEFFGHFDDPMIVSIRGIKTDKLASGTTMKGRLMYVCAIESYVSRSGAVNLRVLRELPEEALAEHLSALGIAGKSSQAKSETKPAADKVATGTSNGKPGEGKSADVKSAEPEFRTWSDKSGKHKIEAILVERTAEKVVLKRRDGTLIPVPIAVLSQVDLDHLKSLAEAAK